MCWDLITLLLCAIGFSVYYYGSNPNKDEYKIKETILYWKSIYGLLSFPYLIFNIPLLETLLTKSRATGYT